MKPKDGEALLNEQAMIIEHLEALKTRVMQIHADIPCIKESSLLSTLLQKMYEIRERLNKLEKELLQTHLKCCISPHVQVPGAVILALSKLSEKRHGAIIVMAHEDNLEDLTQGGIVVDAPVSVPLLENLFYPGSPLHDGAVIIRNNRIQKAGILLPLAPHSADMDRLGLASRHRAALGMSRASDALVIVVSEEKGWISMALNDQLYPNLGTFALLEKLEGAREGSQTE
jgi:DNA integrity scanning protein DisA with diadenylate cyclase activity